MAEPETRPGFILTYDGPALADGRMAVADLAPALMALGDLFHEANAALNPDGPRINLEVRAFDRGSFEVHIDVILREVTNILVGPGVQATLNLVGLITGTRGLFSLVRLLRGRKIRSKEEPTPGMTRITLDDGTVIETPSSVVFLAERESVRRQGRRVLGPLKREGIDEMRIETETEEEPLVVPDEDADAFDAPLEDTLILDTRHEIAVTIVTVSFAANYVWRVSDGESIYSARIADMAFIDRVQKAQEVFRNGDVLRCLMRVEQWQTETGLKTEHTILEVLEHIPGARIVPLPLEEEEEGESEE